MKNRWTMGQYGLYRTILGLYLLQHFLRLLPWGTELFSSSGVLPEASLSPLIHLFPNILALWDSPTAVTACLSSAVVLSVFFTVGKFDRAAAVLIWYLWACLYGRNPLIGNPSLPFVGWLLLAHALIPRSAAGRSSRSQLVVNQGSLPPDIYLAAWILMSLAYSYSGYTKLVSPSWVDGTALSRVLSNPLARDTFLRTLLLSLPPWFLKIGSWFALGLELSFAPLALFRRLRPWVWLAMVTLQLGLMLLVNFADLTAGMLILHLFTFDPAWVPGPQPAGQTVFYDGHCGLCHWFVRFVLEEDRSAQPFSFAPLQGEFAYGSLPEPVRVQLPESVVVLDEKNSVLTRSAAVIYVMKRLGGFWLVASVALMLMPRRLRDLGYSFVASVRNRIAGTRHNLCPIIGEPWSARFLL
jgi:predicted DCC family thiol-disulfide oxidoreductase YuxK